MSFLSRKILKVTNSGPLSISFQRWYAVKPVAALGKKMATKKVGKMGPVVEKKIMPVETDPVKLVNYVCGSNIYTKGEDVKIKPDSEYPDWLWTIHTGPPKKLEELDPETKAYWRKLRQMGLRRNNTFAKLRRF